MNRLHRIGAGLATAALLAAAMWIKTYEVPLKHEATAPIGPSGGVGETVGHRLFRVKVDKYDVATSVFAKSTFGDPKGVSTNEIFLIVYAQVWSDREPFNPSTPRLVTEDGLTYLESSRVKTDDSLFRNYQPQLWYRTIIPFELPKTKLEGVRLVLDNRKIINLLPAKVEVDLGIDKTKADRLRARPAQSYQLQAS